MCAKFEQEAARFCWADLATANTRHAADFYSALFGWQTTRIQANGGEFRQFVADGQPVASMYQLSTQQINAGVPSHWIPYVAVSDLDRAASRAVALGGRILVSPFRVEGIAKVSLIADSLGALTGIWETEN